ncbi:MAG: LysR family transcriptional regulator [Pseudomonadota bacterium]
MKYSDELHAFLAVAHHKSFAEAARSLNLPTTTISRKIRSLESELGAKLFDRTTRSLALTEVAEQLLPKVELIVETFVELKEEADFHTGNPTGTLHITAPATKIQRLAPVFAEFLQAHPGVRFNFDCSSRNKDIVGQGYDFAFRFGPLTSSSLVAIPLSRMKYLLVGNQDVAKRLPAASHPADLAKLPCIRNQIDGLLLPWHFIYEGEPYSLDVESPILSDDLLVSRALAIHGVGLAYLPNSLVQESIDDGELASLYEEWLPPGRQLYLVCADKKRLPSKSSAFLEFIRSRRRIIQQLLIDRP